MASTVWRRDEPGSWTRTNVQNYSPSIYSRPLARLAFISGTVFHHFVTVTLIKAGNSTKCIHPPFKCSWIQIRPVPLVHHHFFPRRLLGGRVYMQIELKFKLMIPLRCPFEPSGTRLDIALIFIFDNLLLYHTRWIPVQKERNLLESIFARSF